MSDFYPVFFKRSDDIPQNIYDALLKGPNLRELNPDFLVNKSSVSTGKNGDTFYQFMSTNGDCVKYTRWYPNGTSITTEYGELEIVSV